MRQDGEGTDERITPDEGFSLDAGWPKPPERRPGSVRSLERDVLLVAVAFAILSSIGWGTFYLSKRAAFPVLIRVSFFQQVP